MARNKNRVRNPGDTKPADEIQTIVNDGIDPMTETETPDIVIKDEPTVEAVKAPVAKSAISIDPDITIVAAEPPKVVLNKGLLGDKMVELIYDMFKKQEPDPELFDYLKLNAAKLVNRISPADILFWKAVLAKLDEIIKKK